MINYSTLKNGLQIITEHLPNVQTVALNWILPAGVVTNTFDGDSAVLAEWVQRGTQQHNSKELQAAIDLLGVQKEVSCGKEFFSVSAVLLKNKLSEAMPLLGSILLNPSLPETDLQACKNLCLQTISSLKDDLAGRVSIKLNQEHFPSPYNRSGYGDAKCIENATAKRLFKTYQETFVPNGAMFTCAGNVNHRDVVKIIEKMTSGWVGSPANQTETKEVASRGAHWIEHDSSQVHIGIALDAPNLTNPKSLHEAIAISILGGATSGRLFTQVRQKRSLCYSVAARYARAKERAVVRIYAGTTPERARETIDVCLQELWNLRKGITQNEFNRACLRMKSRIVMQGESTSARSRALWADYYALGKSRSLAERLDEIDQIDLTSVNDWLQERKFGKLTLVTLGPDELNFSPNQLHDD